MKPGDQIGAYRLIEHIGDGGMAEVWKVEHAVLEQEPKALKLLFPHLARQEDLKARFLDEARVQSGLKHPYILAVHDLIMDQDHVGILMDLAETDLAQYIEERSGPIPWHRARNLFLPLLDAVEYAHEQGLIHRDLKPSNVLLQPQGDQWIPKLTDFGIAK